MAGWNYDGRSSWQCKDIKDRNRKDSKPIREWEDCRCCWFSRNNRKGEIATLGRGGSDTTAVALAAALKANKCDIYTDVTGVFTTDPRVIKNARKLNAISYDEMLELANLVPV